jgi:hypothetical protein
MPLPRKPLSAIVPVVTRTAGLSEDRVHELLGTAFLVGPGLFMSAKHVFGVTPPAGQETAVVLNDSGDLSGHSLKVVYQDSKHDIAIAQSEGWPEEEILTVAPTDNLIMNHNVLTVEYSPTQGGVQLPDGRTAMTITANWQKGNIVREYKPDFGYISSTACIDLSYPALKGASGAPVISEESGYVLGMIVGNIERQIMPAQIERTVRQDGTTDEIRRYFLPSGQAIRAAHLREALSRSVTH